MKKLTITNSDNTKMTVDLVRYFRFKTDCFLIYSIGEVDEKNYKKLYLVRIMEELGFPVVQTIKNDADWANMQGIVKKVLKELKKGKKKLTEDLDYKEIDGIKVIEPRFFKLDSKLVDLLASNYLEENDSVSPEFDEVSIEDKTDMNDIALEPIDQTMMKQTDNTVEKISNEMPIINSLQMENAQLASTIPNLDEGFTEAAFTKNEDTNQIESTNPDEKDVKLSDGIQSIVNVDIPEVEAFIPGAPIEETKIDLNENTSITANNNLTDTIDDTTKDTTNNFSEINLNLEDVKDVDYKKMYDTLKADNDATNELLNAVMTELNQYKEKFGELDAS
ncbi:MAG: hypothetical protein J6G98_01875 [Bacilli bacterium]|nr:hypothetical protein [Bacilli bacterium]